MGRRSTHEEYIKKVAKINPDIEVLGNYVNSREKILHRCRIDGYEWMVDPNHIVSGTGCPLCSKKTKTTQSFISELSEINDTIEVLGEYSNCHKKILCRCKIDGYEWSAAPFSLLHGCGCPVCSGVKHKTHIDYVNDVNKINEDIEVLEEYINAKTPILHKCKICNHIWKVDPHHILSGRGCPVCRQSYGEKEINMYLTKHNILFKRQYRFNECKNIFQLPFDFYLQNYNTCIEYDGEQHYYPIDYFGGEEGLTKRQQNDEIKNNFCKENNIGLLRIKYDQDIKLVLDNFFKNK